mmetsp:Transcript_140589/g.248251  ORF Transcript_140589/g.248251 Transcript_140589/m.248251 type:complete len:212 (-) Transcript_140589:312-947(-)
MKSGNRVKSDVCHLLLRQSERVESIGIIRVLRTTKFAHTEDRSTQRSLRRHHFPSMHTDGNAPVRLPLALLHHVLSLHHVENADVFIAHVLLDLRSTMRTLQICDDGEPVHHFLEQFHLAGAVDIILLAIILVFLDYLSAELKYRTRNLPHGLEHALEGTHSELCDHAGQCEPTEDHYENDEGDVQNGKPVIKLDRLVHIETNHERPCVNQ